MTDRRRDMPALGWIFVSILFAILLLFAPLLASLIEHSWFHTNRVEEFFRQIGLHDLLSNIYRPLVEWLRW